MKTHPNSQQATNPTTDLTTSPTSEVLCQMAIAHDRYTVAFHVTTCQMWVIDSTGRDKPRGPFLASRLAWAEALELNHANTVNTLAGTRRP